jgi:hypothetical protein
MLSQGFFLRIGREDVVPQNCYSRSDDSGRIVGGKGVLEKAFENSVKAIEAAERRDETGGRSLSGGSLQPCEAGAGAPAPGARAQHRRRVRTISWEAISRVASRRLNSGSGTRNQTDPACRDSRDRRPHRRCSRTSQDHGTSGVQERDHGASRHRSIQRVRFRGCVFHRQPDHPDQDRERQLSSLTPESPAKRGWRRSMAISSKATSGQRSWKSVLGCQVRVARESP